MYNVPISEPSVPTAFLEVVPLFPVIVITSVIRTLNVPCSTSVPVCDAKAPPTRTPFVAETVTALFFFKDAILRPFLPVTSLFS